MLGHGAAAHIPRQQQHHAKQRQRQAQHQGRDEVGDQARPAGRRVGPQLQADAGQIHHTLGHVDAGTAWHTGARQACAITFDQGKFVPPRVTRLQHGIQHLGQGQAAHQKAGRLTCLLQGEAQIDHFHALATGQRHEVAA